MLVDLHCHSSRSDGTDAPSEVAAAAGKRAVKLFCLTDHDTWAGHADTVTALPDVTVLRGAELSCREGSRTIHVLIYGIGDGPGTDALAQRLDQVQGRRRERVLEICARFKRLGIELDGEAILARTADRTPGRPHVAQALVEAGVVRDVREAFTRFLRDGGPADVPTPKLSPTEAVELAVGAGARASLAHPHTLGDFGLVHDLFLRCKDLGLTGIEAFYGPYQHAQRGPWLRLARELDLVVTGGSDYHGVAVAPDVVRPGIDLPEPHAERLLGWLGLA